MKSSKLTFSQQKILDQVIRDGSVFPVSHQTQTGRPPTVFDKSKAYATSKLNWSQRPSIRTLRQIKEAGAYEMETFSPCLKSKIKILSFIS